MSNHHRSCLIFFALTAAVAAQPAAREDYDVDYIGAPMADPVLQHTKETYILFGCAYCHGIYLAPRGEAADLMHSALVGRDQNADLIAPLLRAGIPQTAKLSPMPQFSDLSARQLADIAQWIHYARQQGRYREMMETKELPAGEVAAGRAYFDEHCSSCHPAPVNLANNARNQSDAGLRGWILRPPFLDSATSWQVAELNDPKKIARQRHLALLENYTPADLANIIAFLRSIR
jgi:mono/diheme cytochrome c family protein